MPKPLKKPPFSDYSNYTQLAYQIIATILVCVTIGHFADNYFHFQQPWLTLFFGVVGLIISIYLLLKSGNEKEE